MIRGIGQSAATMPPVQLPKHPIAPTRQPQQLRHGSPPKHHRNVIGRSRHYGCQPSNNPAQRSSSITPAGSCLHPPDPPATASRYQTAGKTETPQSGQGRAETSCPRPERRGKQQRNPLARHRQSRIPEGSPWACRAIPRQTCQNPKAEHGNGCDQQQRKSAIAINQQRQNHRNQRSLCPAQAATAPRQTRLPEPASASCLHQSVGRQCRDAFSRPVKPKRSDVVAGLKSAPDQPPRWRGWRARSA